MGAEQRMGERGEAYQRERRRRRSLAVEGRQRREGECAGGGRRECEKDREKGESEGKKWVTVVRWETKTRRAHGRASRHGRPYGVLFARLMRKV